MTRRIVLAAVLALAVVLVATYVRADRQPPPVPPATDNKMLETIVTLMNAQLDRMSRDNAELRQMGPDRVDDRSLLPDEEVPRTMKHQAALLFGRLGRHEPHVGPGDRLADCLGVGGIVLLPLDVGLHVGRRHQPHGMAERRERA